MGSRTTGTVVSMMAASSGCEPMALSRSTAQSWKASAAASSSGRGSGAVSLVSRRSRPSRRQEAAAERKKSPTHKSEYVDMHTAYCDENPKNAETFPCLTHRMRSTDAGSEERDKLLQQLKAASPDDRTSQREDMMRFWCEDPTTNRSESGVCLSWRKRSQLSALHTPEKLKAMGEKPGAMLKENQPFNQMRSELERMHEWYCTTRASARARCASG